MYESYSKESSWKHFKLLVIIKNKRKHNSISSIAIITIIETLSIHLGLAFQLPFFHSTLKETFIFVMYHVFPFYFVKDL